MNGQGTLARGRLLPTVLGDLWLRLGDDYRQNCLAWHHAASPLLAPAGEGWRSVWTANPDFLRWNGRDLLYFRATGISGDRTSNHDRIGVAEVLGIRPGELEVRMLNNDRPILDVGQPDDFDGTDILDPATVVFNGKVYLYYSAIGPGPDRIGLAVSDDGESFTKVGCVGIGRAPDVVPFGDRLRMVYQRADADGNYRVYLAESADGITFADVMAEPVLAPRPGEWDGLSIATVRLTQEGDFTYALFGGSAYLADEPEYFGLARSLDLVTWERHPGNPIFGCGAKGMPDGGAIWFPAFFATDEGYFLLYEGSPGKMSWDLHSAICGAWITN